MLCVLQCFLISAPAKDTLTRTKHIFTSPMAGPHINANGCIYYCAHFNNTMLCRIIFSAPAKDDSHTIVMGVNQETYETSMTEVSCASCTTNGLAPTVKVRICVVYALKYYYCM
jgi:hypothetical protein